MNHYEILLLAMAAVLFAVMLALAAAECVREMHAEATRQQPAAPVKRPLYVEDLRHGSGSAR